MTSNGSSADQRFIALTNRHMMAFYAIRKLAERNRDTAHDAVESARLGLRDWLDVGQQWTKRPDDLASLLDAATQAAVNHQARSLEVARKWWDGIRALRP